MDEEELNKLKEAGKIAKTARDESKAWIKEGAKVLDIANKIEDRIKELGGECAFPVNTSINSIAAHYTPIINDETVLKKGDLIKVDLGAHVDGFVSDTAYSVEIGSNQWKDLIKASENALKAAIDIIKPGVEISKVGEAVENEITSLGFKPIANLSGHTIENQVLHAGISVPNFDNGGTTKLEEGTTVAIEPFATDGIGKVIDAKDSDILRLETLRPVRHPIARKILKYLDDKERLLPFAKRWLIKEIGGFGVESGVKALVRSGVLHQYPVLKEGGDGTVSQAEHTILVFDDPIVTTL